MNQIKILLVTLWIMLPGMLDVCMAAGREKHSKLEVSASLGSNGEQVVQFKVVPIDGMQLTLDAPWALNLEANPQLNLPKASRIKKIGGAEISVYSKELMDDKMPGYAVPIAPKSAQATVLKYKLEAFACTDNKERCFKDQHEGAFKIEGMKKK